mmetsp:Transcript_1156/g.1613  ORF Transcript_1156/g.1613 Transcript_1156/m.1613 type:complete len:348 (+) Transcript_1156:2-1045(+)
MAAPDPTIEMMSARRALLATLFVNFALIGVMIASIQQQEVGSAVRAHNSMKTPVMRQIRGNSLRRVTKAFDAISGTHDGAPDGLKTLKLTHPSGSEAVIYEFGAAVTSFKDSAGTEWLAVRPDAKFDGTKAISGGIPHCFPQFGPGVLPQHGFARDAHWEMVKAEGSEAVFQLTDSERTREIWDYPFKATYSVNLLEDSLKTKLEVQNTGEKTFEFTGALHSYFDVSNIDDIQIEGPFTGKTIIDRMQDPPASIEMSSDLVGITEETDQIVEGVVGSVKINDKGKGKSLLIKSTQGWSDTVLWNPYGNEGMGYKNFVCVEAAAASKPVSVAPGSSWVADMDLIPSAL